MDRKPHIGEYDAKTNAICDVRPIPAASALGRKMAWDARGALLSVVLQHLIAGLRYLGTILLQASQNGEIALIHDRAAVALNVACASRLFLRRAAALLLLRDGAGGDG
jgi:hypothetical protein